MSKRIWDRALKMNEDQLVGRLHHFYKYHDPQSEFYAGEDCMDCEFSDIQKELRTKTEQELWRSIIVTIGTGKIEEVIDKKDA